MASKPKVPTIPQIVAAHGGYPTCQYCAKKLQAATKRVRLRSQIGVVPTAPVRVNFRSPYSRRRRAGLAPRG
jgi:hypothetical protein